MNTERDCAEDLLRVIPDLVKDMVAIEWKKKYVARFVEVARNSAEASFEVSKKDINFLKDDPVKLADESMEGWG